MTEQNHAETVALLKSQLGALRRDVAEALNFITAARQGFVLTLARRLRPGGVDAALARASILLESTRREPDSARSVTADKDRDTPTQPGMAADLGGAITSDSEAAADALAKQLARGPAFDRRFFQIWERNGFHITANHFYEPVPDVSKLDDSLWQRAVDLVGVDMNESGQLALLDTVAARYKAEYDQFPLRATADPTQYHFDQPMFRSVDAEMLYSMIRHSRPRRMVEIGSGYSTLLAAAACRRNREEGHPTELTCIEPHPTEVLHHGLDGVTRLVARPLQEIDDTAFGSLGANDILFIDSSHVLRIGNDVHREYLSILPKLASGVLVHVHDIFLPDEYPRAWVKEEFRFWTEQYLLHAFLMFNDAFKVRWAGNYMHQRHPDKLRHAFRSYDPSEVLPGSFWIQRV